MIKYAFLGIVQGLTEFFPVSSKGHLVFLQHAMGLRGEEIVLPLVLHAGTLVAVVFFLRKEIRRLFTDGRLALLVLTSTVITGIIGVAGEKFFKGLFLRPAVVAPGMIFTGIVLLSLRKRQAQATRETLGFRDAAAAGLAQALALVPGISRSGMTISALLWRKVDRETCFNYSFLISIPAVLGATLLESRHIKEAIRIDFVNLAVGFAFSLVFGLVALSLLKRVMAKDKFHWFGYYCLTLGAALLWLGLRG